MSISAGSESTPFAFPTYILDGWEYAKIVSEINTNYGMYRTDLFCIHTSVGRDGHYYMYYFENHGYNEYNIYGKVEF